MDYRTCVHMQQWRCQEIHEKISEGGRSSRYTFLSTRNFNELNGKKLKVNKILKCYLYNNSFQILADIKDAVLDDVFEN